MSTEEALDVDDYIDFYEYGTVRSCLLDSKGNRLKDAEGNFKTISHKFANSWEELYELFETLICCYKRAGIQVKKASKAKLGVENSLSRFTITRLRRKEHNLRMPTCASFITWTILETCQNFELFFVAVGYPGGYCGYCSMQKLRQPKQPLNGSTRIQS
jgi:hypothetical protein